MKKKDNDKIKKSVQTSSACGKSDIHRGRKAEVNITFEGG